MRPTGSSIKVSPRPENMMQANVAGREMSGIRESGDKPKP
jgi:hypothetical protein